MDNTFVLITLCALATYATRASGYVLMSRFGRINHRVEAALNAVPTAVLSALIAPYLVSKGPLEAVSIVLTALLVSRVNIIFALAVGLGFLAAARAMMGA